MNIKRIIPACLSLLALGLASCVDTNTSTEEPKHMHTFASEWSKDSNGHWHACTGEGCEVVSGNEEHHGGSATCTTKAVCEDCGESYGELLAHTYDQKVVKDTYLKSAATHSAKASYFYSCTCGEKGTETFEVGETVAHSKAESWSSDANNHWKACTAEGCEDIKLDSEAHKLVEKVDAAFLKSEATHSAKAVYYKSCETCGYKSTETFENGEVVAHTPSAKWTTNETNHWHTCTTTGCESVKLDDAAHNYDQKVMTETYKASAATCTANETYYFSCVCGVKGTTTFEKEETMLQHDYNTEKFESDGTNHWHKCNDCTATSTPEQHTIVEEGNVEKCSVCGYVAHTHVWAEELTKGETTHWYACTVNNCLEKKDEEAHTYEAQGTTVKQQQSCTSPELIAKTCDCGAEHETETWESKPALGHTYDQEVANQDTLATAATCTEAATYYKTCSCGAEGTETFVSGSAKGHDAATVYSADENNHWRECTVCGEDLDKTTHVYDQNEVNSDTLASAATCTEAAQYYKSCVCGVNGTETFVYGEPSHTPKTYYITVVDGDNVKYLEVYKNSNNKYRFRLVDQPTNYWTYDAEHNTFLMKLDGSYYFIGTYDTYQTFSPSKSYYFTAGNYIAHLYNDGSEVNTFELNTEYSLALFQGNASVNKLLYFAGSADSNGFLLSTDNAESASSIKIAQAVGKGTFADIPYSFDSQNHWKECLFCDVLIDKGAHEGGTATCEEKAVCTICKNAYGDVLGHVYDTKLSNLGSQHAHVCTRENCTSTDTPVDHDFTNGDCECGATENQVVIYTHVFAKEQLTKAAQTVGLSNINWEQSALGYVGWDSNASAKGVQLGSGNAPATSFTLTSDFSSMKITKIVVNASIGNSGDGKLSISVGETIGLNSQVLTTSAKDYEALFDNASGEVTIKFTCTKKAMYIKSITIYYTNA